MGVQQLLQLRRNQRDNQPCLIYLFVISLVAGPPWSAIIPDTVPLRQRGICIMIGTCLEGA